MPDIMIYFLLGLVAFVLACIKDELAKIRKVLEEVTDLDSR